MEFAKEKPEYLEGKAARLVESSDSRSQSDADEEVDPVDYLADSFWQGVTKTGELFESAAKTTDMLVK